MCGLAGVFQFSGDPVAPSVLRRMGDALIHRGPDGFGSFIDSNFGFIHRRLSIIDTSPAGHQPMSSKCNRYTLVYNGELYNYQELRIKLESNGVQFHTSSDTEVVLNALAFWGIDEAIVQFNGMFAFALWDSNEKRLFLARDRYGVKPLYIARINNSFLFGSEIKSLMEYPAFSVKVNKRGLQEYLTFQNFFGSQTLFSGVELLPAGSYTVVNHSGSTYSSQFWDYSFEEPTSPYSDEDYLEELSRLFTQAVNRQLVSDVEIGSYLSGGMDSGAITSIASSSLDYLKSFTCGFDLRSASGLELNFDERKDAEYMSYLFKTEHYQMVLKSGDMERAMQNVTYAIEEPRVGQSYPNYYASGLASKFVKVVLSGTGGDELFAGYPWRYYKAVTNNDFDHYISKYYAFWQRLIPSEFVSKVFKPLTLDTNLFDTKQIFKDVFPSGSHTLCSPEDYINHSLYFEAKTFLHGLLIVEDKLSMSHSLETRVPFLDNDLVDFATKVPTHLKLGNLDSVIRLNENDPGLKTEKYFSKTNDGKLLLRNAMKKFMPESITGSVKQGFSAPDSSWFQGESIDYVKKALFSSSTRLYEYLDRDTVHVLLEDHLEGRVNRRLFVWSMLTLEQWLRTFL